MNNRTVPATLQPVLASPCVDAKAAAVTDTSVVTAFLSIFSMLVLPSPPSGGFYFCGWRYVKANVSSGPDHNLFYHPVYYFWWNILLPDPFAIDFQITYNRRLFRDSHLLV